MNKLRIPTSTALCAFACAFACALAVPTASLADTIAWWHFDEGTIGTKAAASTATPSARSSRSSPPPTPAP